VYNDDNLILLPTDKSINGILHYIKQALQYTDADKAEPYWLLCHVLSCSRSELQQFDFLDDSQIVKVQEIVQSRTTGIPLDYIFGNTNFYGLDIQVNPDVLIPRMETELLCEWVIKYINNTDKTVTVLDLCTGSGCISAAIGSYCNNVILTATDISSQACLLARQNLQNLLKDNVDWQIVLSDLFDSIPLQKYDIIVSNPPYIAKKDKSKLSQEVLNQPSIALFGGDDGLDIYRRVANQAFNYLKNGGMLALEIGYNQANCVVELLRYNKFENIEVIKDYSGLDRIVVANKNTTEVCCKI